LVGGADHRSLPEPEPGPDGEGQAGPVARLDQLDLAAQDRGQQPGLAGQGRRVGQGRGLPGGKGISLATTPVTVLNGSGAAGAAARAATDLRRLGVRVVGTGNAPTPTGTASTLAYPPALARQARLLASVLGGKVKLVRAADGASLTLTVGSGFRLR